MKCSLIKKSDCKTSDWRGGKTTELAIFPPTKKYIDRDFVWRLSSATIDLEESDFTKLAGYDRVIMPLEGEVVLTFNDEKTVKLRELEQTAFSGEWMTKSFGRITDFNLMTRRGAARGALDVIEPASEAARLSHESSSGDKTTHALYLRDGYAVVNVGGDSYMLKCCDTLLLEYEEGEAPAYSIMGEGHIIRAVIRYSYKREESEPVFIPREKASFDDYKCALFLANTQFRFADRIFKRIRQKWYDEELSGAIRRLERLYVTFLAGMVGLMAILMTVFEEGMSDLTLLLIIFCWFAFDIAVISPLIYMIFLPKPIRKHIKDIDALTPYERTVRERELGGNERLEKLMKKYKNSGKNLGYDKEGKNDLL